MQLRGIVMSATLDENPPDSGIVEMTIRVQGVGAGQPRRIVLPFAILIQDETLEPESIQGHGFLAEVVEGSDKRWHVVEIVFAQGRVLRNE